MLNEAETILPVVSRAWHRILGGHAPPLDRSWDEAGGNSLQFLRLIFELEETLGRSMPPGSFTIDMNPAEMAAAIDRAPRDEAAPANDTVRLFLFPGVGGDEPLLAALRDDLQAHLSIVTLQYPGWAVISDPGFGFADLVGETISQITQAAPDGAVHLAGYSYGGIVAFAAARQLRLAGREVAFLGLLDTDIASPRLSAARGVAGFLARFARSAGALARQNRHDNLCRTMAHYLLAPRARGLSLRLLDPRRNWLRPDARFALNYWLCRFRRTESARGWLDALADPDPGIRTFLFRSEDRPVTDAPDLGWWRHIPSLNVVAVQGDHFSMLTTQHRSDLTRQLLLRVSAPRG